jgi:hypothetical protein
MTHYLFIWLVEGERIGGNNNPLSYPHNSRARICKRLSRPGIDSDGSIPPAYVAWRASTTNRVVVPASQAGNRFLGSLKGLQIRALAMLKVSATSEKNIRPKIGLISVPPPPTPNPKPVSVDH